MRVTKRQFIAGGLASTLAPNIARAASQKRSNIVFIMADDLGWGDLSCYGNTDFETPALDRLAAEGVRLRQAFANSCVCSPTRMALITGRYQYRLRAGLEEPIRDKPKPVHGLPPSHPTLPWMLRQAGYATALVGKWHLGFLPDYGPLKSGYDEFFGISSGAADYFTHKSRGGMPDLYDGERSIEAHGYLTDLLTARAVQYVSRAAARSQPFLLSLHYTAPHWPWETAMDGARAAKLKDLFDLGGGSLQSYAAMVRSLDDGVARVLDALTKAGADENTIVIFTSDNGGERYSRMWPLSGEKGDLLEGGIRVPAIVRFPGFIPAGRVSDQVAITMDWTAVMLGLAEAPPVLPLDGIDVLPMIAGRAPEESRTLFWRLAGQDQAAVRAGPLKYLRIGTNEFLFNIEDDPRERANLVPEDPVKLRELQALYARWNADMLPDDDITGFVLGAGQVAGGANPDR